MNDSVTDAEKAQLGFCEKWDDGSHCHYAVGPEGTFGGITYEQLAKAQFVSRSRLIGFLFIYMHGRFRIALNNRHYQVRCGPELQLGS